MSTIKSLLIEQIQSVISSYSPYLDLLSEQGRKDYQELNQCLEILKKE